MRKQQLIWPIQVGEINHECDTNVPHRTNDVFCQQTVGPLGVITSTLMFGCPCCMKSPFCSCHNFRSSTSYKLLSGYIMSTNFIKQSLSPCLIGLPTNDKYSIRAKLTKRVKFYKSSMLIVTQPKTEKEVRVTWQYLVHKQRNGRLQEWQIAHAAQLLNAGATEVMEYMEHSIMKDKPFEAVKECGLGLGHICSSLWEVSSKENGCEWFGVDSRDICKDYSVC
jgi:hypothetical protein